MELQNIRVTDVTFISPTAAVVNLGLTKSGQRRRAAEVVTLEDPLVIESLRVQCAGLHQLSPILNRAAALHSLQLTKRPGNRRLPAVAKSASHHSERPLG
eukprot:3395333-Amphidinium_carterae.1